MVAIFAYRRGIAPTDISFARLSASRIAAYSLVTALIHTEHNCRSLAACVGSPVYAPPPPPWNDSSMSASRPSSCCAFAQTVPCLFAVHARSVRKQTGFEQHGDHTESKRTTRDYDRIRGGTSVQRSRASFALPYPYSTLSIITVKHYFNAQHTFYNCRACPLFWSFTYRGLCRKPRTFPRRSICAVMPPSVDATTPRYVSRA